MSKHVRWCFNATKWIPTKDQWINLSAALPYEELDRINKFVYKEDAKTSLIGQILIRAFLSQSLDKPSSEIPLIRNDHGRPQLVHDYSDKIDCQLDFNVSHSGDHCVFVGYLGPRDTGVRIGVDVTRIVRKKTKEELDRFLSLMSKRDFLESEWRNVSLAKNDRDKCVQFTRLWCLKESFIKAIGLGLAYDLKRIEFVLKNNEIRTNFLSATTTVKVDGHENLDWTFFETRLDEEHLVAIGYHSKTAALDLAPETNFAFINVEQVMKWLRPMQEADDKMWEQFCKKHTKASS